MSNKYSKEQTKENEHLRNCSIQCTKKKKEEKEEIFFIIIINFNATHVQNGKKLEYVCVCVQNKLFEREKKKRTTKTVLLQIQTFFLLMTIKQQRYVHLNTHCSLEICTNC